MLRVWHDSIVIVYHDRKSTRQTTLNLPSYQTEWWRSSGCVEIDLHINRLRQGLKFTVSAKTWILFYHIQKYKFKFESLISKTLLFVWFTLDSEDGARKVLQAIIKLHGITSRKIVLFVFNAVRSWDVIWNFKTKGSSREFQSPVTFKSILGHLVNPIKPSDYYMHHMF
jgi:hypothetical protein